MKAVPADKMDSLGKLPSDVRNKMGYKKAGGYMKKMGGGYMKKMKKGGKTGITAQIIDFTKGDNYV